MKTELRLAAHQILPGQNVIEIWWNGRMIGQVTGANDGPGVRVLSKYPLGVGYVENTRATPVCIVEVKVVE